MTWRWWLFAVALALAIEVLARTRYGVWADRIALTLLFVAGINIIVRRVKQS